MAAHYLTTPIYYVNDRPHIGHLYTTVVTDALARFFRFRGDDVRLLTGTDEHGQNIEKVARKEGVAPIVVADRHAPTFRNLWKTFGISNDDFIRTSEARHRRGVEALIARIEKAGDFYLHAHEGWYCPNCEAFYPEKELVHGNCPVHGFKPEWQKEENVFFRLSKYGPKLLELYAARPDFVFPKTRLNEVKSFVEAGLKDLSVSRTSITWGIPFPGHPGHVVYVWLDALANYITGLGFGSADDSLYTRYWPGSHVIGKDILRFHAVYWPAFLMAAGLPVPTQVVSHGWWLHDQKKMSKSTGNVVRPDELVAAFGVDALRWFLVAEMTFGQDASFSDEDFLAKYNADLANGLGNTLSRAVRMAADAFGGKTPPEPCDDNDIRGAAESAAAAWSGAFESYRLQDAAAAIRTLVSAIDGYITAKEPWKLVKTGGVTPALSRIHYNCLEGLRIAAVLLAPIAPSTAEEVLKRLGASKKAHELSPKDLVWGGLPTNAPLAMAPPLFPRADAKEYFASRGGGEGNGKKGDAMTDDNSTFSSKVNETPPAAGAATQGGTADSAASGNSPSKQNPNAPDAAAPLKRDSDAPAPTSGTEKISIADFMKIDLRVGEVLAAEKVEKSKKLMKMSIRIGEEVRTIVGGIATAYTPEQLVGRKLVIVANLAPAKLMGVESNGMVLAATMPDTGEPSLVAVEAVIPTGAKVK
jgi:methionyl-tRNA synthetase